MRDLGLIPGLGGYPGEGKGYELQYSGLGNSIYCTVHGVAKSQTRLNDFHFHCSLSCLDMNTGTQEADFKSKFSSKHPFLDHLIEILTHHSSGSSTVVII